MNNEVKNRTRAQRISDNQMEIRKRLWPEIVDEMLWNRKKEKGFTTIPRTMPYILKIMDEIASPIKVSGAYFALWCYVFDESFVTITNPSQMALEAGFSGQRAVTTWRDRMKKLQELKFIDAKSGSSGPYHYVLIFNPFNVIETHRKNGNIVSETTINVFFERAIAIGALEPYE